MPRRKRRRLRNETLVRFVAINAVSAGTSISAAREKGAEPHISSTAQIELTGTMVQRPLQSPNVYAQRFRLTWARYTHVLDVEGVMRGIIGLLFYSVVALAPILVGVFIASRFLLRRDRLIGLAPLSVVIGFLAGGVVGWAFVPAQWTASFWTTVEAAGNAAKYGESFEHMAEHALLYFFYSALLGAVAFGVAALVVVWRVPSPPAARPLP